MKRLRRWVGSHVVVPVAHRGIGLAKLQMGIPVIHSLQMTELLEQLLQNLHQQV